MQGLASVCPFGVAETKGRRPVAALAVVVKPLPVGEQLWPGAVDELAPLGLRVWGV